MKIWIVFVRETNFGERWIDSMWAEDKHAVSRAVELRDSMKACGANKHEVFYTQGCVADAAIQSTATPQQPSDGTQGGQ